MFETPTDEASQLVERALNQEPRLGHFGFGVFDEKRKLRVLGADAIGDELASNRAELTQDLASVRAAADWIKGQERTAGFNQKHTSYGYKHCVERWFGDQGRPQYVANGSFIAAAIGLGWRHEVDGPNALFCFSDATIAKPCHDLSGGCYVYFVQAGRGDHGAIKIGHSRDVNKRVEQLRTGNHLELALLAKVRCLDVASAIELELELHERFARLRLNGEWFRWSEEILEAAGVTRLEAWGRLR